METKHHKPIVYKIYETLKSYVGVENAIRGRDLAAMFCISERTLREHIETIRQSTELEKTVSSCNKGYFICTREEDFDRYNQRLFSQAFSLLKTAYANERKAGRDGQGKIPFGKYYKKFVESFGEVAE